MLAWFELGVPVFWRTIYSEATAVCPDEHTVFGLVKVIRLG
jgi:hypothetical protein